MAHEHIIIYIIIFCSLPAHDLRSTLHVATLVRVRARQKMTVYWWVTGSLFLFAMKVETTLGGTGTSYKQLPTYHVLCSYGR